MGKKAKQTQFHRSQIGRAQRHIRTHLSEPLTLVGIAREAGSSSFHFARSGKYGRFLLTGPYTQIWPAFDQMFKTLAENKVELRPEYCIENYLNNPQDTSEARLLTELLIPIA